MICSAPPVRQRNTFESIFLHGVVIVSSLSAHNQAKHNCSVSCVSGVGSLKIRCSRECHHSPPTFPLPWTGSSRQSWLIVCKSVLVLFFFFLCFKVWGAQIRSSGWVCLANLLHQKPRNQGWNGHRWWFCVSFSHAFVLLCWGYTARFWLYLRREVTHNENILSYSSKM